MELTIITPHKKLVENEPADEFFFPGVEGQLNVLPEHANFVTQLETGVISWRKGAVLKKAAISFGWLEIFKDQVTVLADVSELSSDIDLTRAKNAEKESRKKIEEGGLDNADFEKMELKLKRSLARQSTSEGL